MRVTVNNHFIDPFDIDLDPFGWDSHKVRGHLSLILSLRNDELLLIGRKIWDFAQEAIAAESDYFEGGHRLDNPVPTSERMFVEEPELLAVYLDNNFWSRETVLAILGLVTDDAKYNPVPAPYLIQDFRQLELNAGTVQLEFGAVPGRHPV